MTPINAAQRLLLDEKRRHAVCTALELGCNRRTAARFVGCAQRTIIRAAEIDPQFAAELGLAETNHEVLHARNIQAAGHDPRYWRASAWALERKYPQRYGLRRPNLLTPEEISQAFSRMGDLVAEHVPNDQQRKELLRSLNELTEKLSCVSPDASPAHEAPANEEPSNRSNCVSGPCAAQSTVSDPSEPEPLADVLAGADATQSPARDEQARELRSAFGRSDL